MALGGDCWAKNRPMAFGRFAPELPALGSELLALGADPFVVELGEFHGNMGAPATRIPNSAMSKITAADTNRPILFPLSTTLANSNHTIPNGFFSPIRL